MSVNSKMTAIADKIRTLLGLTGTMGLDEMAAHLGTEQSNVTAALAAIAGKGVTVPEGSNSDSLAALIAAIEAGGGGGTAVTVSMKDVNFYDYDETLVASYTLAEAQALTALPEGPTHDGLIFQGWNWTLEKINALTSPMNVGAMYITDDGKARLHIRVWDKARSTVPLYFSQTVANGVTIDWGDGSAAETISGTGNVNTSHAYGAAGDYTISLAAADGCTIGLGSGSTNYCVMGSTKNIGRAYCNLLQSVNIGDSVTSIGGYAFQPCYSLASITIPDSVTSIDKNAFQNCYSLASITIPDSVTSIGNSAFYSCVGVAKYHLKPTTPPTLASTNAFTSIPSDCIIYVPQGCLDAYQTATNWSNYASYMQEEPA